VHDFPKSPESELSGIQLEKIRGYNSKKTAYIPDKRSIRETDRIDIRPELDIDERENNKTEIQYSISLGPFLKINNARKIRDLIKKDFPPVEIARLRNGYGVYAGKFMNIDSAVSTRIRLAEEFGINGNIVKIVRDGEKLYIYEE
jgi:hypothetical protein